MSPVRILILGVLFYLLYKLLFSKKSEKEKVTGQQNSADHPLQDVLVEDPVCHTFVAKGQAKILQTEDETHYFCSDECRETFQNNKEPEE